MIHTAGTLQNPVLCIVGPTASGKTQLAQSVAEQLDTSVLSADSMQVYRGMDIGTAKIPQRERTVPYYGLDIADIDHPYSVQQYQEYGRSIIEELDNQGLPCVVCGGTGFYVRALIDCFEFPAGEQVGNVTRDYYMHMAQHQGAQAVWDTLYQLDEASARIISPNDIKRVVRALELLEDGTTYADQKEKFSAIEQYYPACLVGIEVNPDILRQRIDARVDTLIENGLVEEVSRLLNAGLKDALTANAAIGYKELIPVIEGTQQLDQAIEQIKTATRQYAKRQRTWFRKDKRITWIDGNDIQSSSHVASMVDQTLALYCSACEQMGIRGN